MTRNQAQFWHRACSPLGMILRFCILLLFTLSFQAGAQIVCVKDQINSWIPKIKSTQTRVGYFQNFSGKKDACKQAIIPGKFGTCVKGMNNWKAFDSVTGKSLGKTEFEYSQETCLDVINKSVNGFTCVPQSVKWTPQKPGTSFSTDFTFSYHSQCLTFLGELKSSFSCLSTDRGQRIIALQNDHIVSASPLLMTSAQCQKFLSDAKTLVPQTSNQAGAQTFFHNEPDRSIGYNRRQCEDDKLHGHQVKTDATGVILPECVPDTLYSWGGIDKAEWFRKSYEGPGDWSAELKRPFYLTTSPIGTFAYGDVAIRVKLKPNVKVVLNTETTKKNKSCNDLTPVEKANTIILHQWTNGSGSGLDYILCSMGPVTSWSYGTEEHFDEILSDYKWIERHSRADYELYYKTNGSDDLWDLDLDHHTFTREKFDDNLGILKSLISGDLGGVWFQNGKDLREDHFKTRRPTYSNPN